MEGKGINDRPTEDEMKESKLLPCPFCGGEASLGTVTYDKRSEIVRLNKQQTFYGVNCIECGATTFGIIGSKTEEEAKQRWNTRVNFRHVSARSEGEKDE